MAGETDPATSYTPTPRRQDEATRGNDSIAPADTSRKSNPHRHRVRSARNVKMAPLLVGTTVNGPSFDMASMEIEKYMKPNIVTYAHALSSPTRLYLLQSVGLEGLSVTEAAHRANLSTSTTSFHLGVLLDAGLVSRKRRGRCVLYKWSDTRLSLQVERVRPASAPSSGAP